QVTKLGRLLDPIADKLLVLSGLIILVQLQRVAAVVAILIIAREVAVTGVRAIAASQGIVLSAETIGKYKMVAQVVAIVLLILEDGIVPAAWNLHLVGTVVLYAALALALISGVRYLLSSWRQVALKGLYPPRGAGISLMLLSDWLPAAMAAGGDLLGSIPFGVVVAKCLGGVDPRTAGSRNIGFTNVLRVAGTTAGLLTLAGDAGKGWLVGWMASQSLDQEAWVRLVELCQCVAHAV